jgi:hypothetical protein
MGQENFGGMSGPVTDQEFWRTRTNQELREVFRNPDLMTDMKSEGCSGLYVRLVWIMSG